MLALKLFEELGGISFDDNRLINKASNDNISVGTSGISPFQFLAAAFWELRATTAYLDALRQRR